MKKYFNIKKKDQKGFTLLEYCAGAAIMIGVVVAGMGIMGDGLNEYFRSLGRWVEAQGDAVNGLPDVVTRPRQ